MLLRELPILELKANDRPAQTFRMLSFRHEPANLGKRATKSSLNLDGGRRLGVQSSYGQRLATGQDDGSTDACSDTSK